MANSPAVVVYITDLRSLASSASDHDEMQLVEGKTTVSVSHLLETTVG